MPADAVGAPELVYRLCTDHWNRGCRPCLPSPAGTQPAGTHLPHRSPPPNPHGLLPWECGDSPAGDDMRHHWLSLAVTHRQPGPAGSGKWGWSVQGVEGACEFCWEFSLCPWSPVIAVCHVRAVSVTLSGAGSEGEQPRLWAGPLVSLRVEFSLCQIPLILHLRPSLLLLTCLDSVLRFGEKESVSTIERARKRKYQNLSAFLSCRLPSESELGGSRAGPREGSGRLASN